MIYMINFVFAQEMNETMGRGKKRQKKGDEADDTEESLGVQKQFRKKKKY